jgi:hypothetical protein
VTAVAGSMGPNRLSRAGAEGSDEFSRRPATCLIALGPRGLAVRRRTPKRRSKR